METRSDDELLEEFLDIGAEIFIDEEYNAQEWNDAYLAEVILLYLSTYHGWLDQDYDRRYENIDLKLLVDRKILVKQKHHYKYELSPLYKTSSLLLNRIELIRVMVRL